MDASVANVTILSWNSIELVDKYLVLASRPNQDFGCMYSTHTGHDHFDQ